jgi:hypothetical protein
VASVTPGRALYSVAADPDQESEPAVPVFIKDERYVLFPHVPKTGGTSIERHFRQHGWQMHLRDARTGRGTMHYARRCSPQHMQASLLREVLRLDRIDVVFMVVREPIARFRSEYAMRAKDATLTDAASVDAWADRVLARYEEDPYAIDNHLRPQHEFWLPDALVYKLEDGIEAAVADLNQRFDLGLPATVKHRLRSEDRHGMASGAVEISPGLEARLRTLYARDFEQFGY